MRSFLDHHSGGGTADASEVTKAWLKQSISLYSDSTVYMYYFRKLNLGRYGSLIFDACMDEVVSYFSIILANLPGMHAFTTIIPTKADHLNSSCRAW